MHSVLLSPMRPLVIVAAVAGLSLSTPSPRDAHAQVKLDPKKNTLGKRLKQGSLHRCKFVDLTLEPLRLKIERAVSGGFQVKLITRPRNMGLRKASRYGWEIQFFNGAHMINQAPATAHMGGLKPMKDFKSHQDVFHVTSDRFKVHMGEFLAEVSAKVVQTNQATPLDRDCNMSNNVVRIRKKELKRQLFSYRQ